MQVLAKWVSNLEIMEKSIRNKKILIVGANGSMAKETIKHLIKDGANDIVMACRTKQKGIKALQEIVEENPQAIKRNISVVGGFDMTNPTSIEMAVQTLPFDVSFDVIFLAAGFAIFTDDYQAINWNGKKIEATIFQNMIGSHLTLLQLRKYNLIAKGARVLMAGGEGARGLKGMIEKPEFNSAKELSDYIFLKKNPKYNPMNAIGVSKLCGALWTARISKLEKDNMSVIWFSPGLTSGSAGLIKLPLVKRIFMSLFFEMLSLIGKSQNPKEGARKYADCLEGKIGENGDLLGAPEGKSIGTISDQTPMNQNFSNEYLINEFWTILEGVSPWS